MKHPYLAPLYRATLLQRESAKGFVNVLADNATHLPRATALADDTITMPKSLSYK
jgi:hypothetical protein